MALSRRSALAGAVAAALAPSAASGRAPTPSRAPVGPLTLAQAEVVDFAAVWASLSPEAQARIGVLAIEAETFDQIGQDGGFHTTEGDRGTAEAWANDARHEALPAAIWAALPNMLPTVYDEPYPLWQVLDGRKAPSKVDVRGVGSCRLVNRNGEWFAWVGPDLVGLGGAVDLDNRDDSTPPRWQFWTIADIEAERIRRHSEMACRGDTP